MDGFLGDLSARSADASASIAMPPVASLVNSVVVHCQPAGAVDAVVASIPSSDASSGSSAAVGGAGAGAGGSSSVLQLAPLPTSSALGVQIIALRWLKRLVELGGRSLLPLLSGVLAALLPCFALQSPTSATAAASALQLQASASAGVSALSPLGGRDSPTSITTGLLGSLLFSSLLFANYSY